MIKILLMVILTHADGEIADFMAYPMPSMEQCEESAAKGQEATKDKIPRGQLHTYCVEPGGQMYSVKI